MTPARCIVCGGSQWERLPDPGPQSMASDWRVIQEPLAKAACRQCGLVARAQVGRTPATLFSDGYSLYAHAPGGAREAARQRAYANWIAEHVPAAPQSIVDVGCGNGSLLRAMRSIWPGAGLFGCDLSPESVSAAAAAGVRAVTGTADAIPADIRGDLVVSVNVIEHTPDPLGFLRTLAGRVAPGGRLVVVHPDGGRADVELLMADHLYSFAPSHLDALAIRGGLQITHGSLAPAALGSFQLVVAQLADDVTAAPRSVPSVPITPKREYLSRWAALDAALLRQAGTRRLVCFGIGEAAGLLRAYAPCTWDRVEACTADDVIGSGSFADRPTCPLVDVSAASVILLGVRPADQTEVAERLRGQFAAVIRWDRLLAIA